MAAQEVDFEDSIDPNSNRVCIIQITRIGDLIQTVEAVKRIKSTNSELKFDLVARERFASPIRFILDEYFDRIFYFDGKNVFKHTNLKGCLDQVKVILEAINERPYDLCVNLSFSKPSKYMAGLISANKKAGPYIGTDGIEHCSDHWSQYLMSSVQTGNLNPFSLVDLYKNIIETYTAPSEYEEVPAKKIDGRKIVLHPFGSQKRKIWKSLKWVELIYKLLKEDEETTVTIVGSPEEQTQSKSITENPLLGKFLARISNKVGKTSLKETSDVVKESDLFIGHDSMVGHLAAFHNVRTITVSLGNSRPWETTPYINNAITVYPATKCFPCFPTDDCDYFKCHNDVNFQLVADMANKVLSGSDEQILNKESLPPFVYDSTFATIAQKENNSPLNLRNIKNDFQNVDNSFRSFYFILWNFILSDKEVVTDHLQINEETASILVNYLSGIQYLFELTEFGKKYSKFILEEFAKPTPNIMEIKNFSNKIGEIEYLMETVKGNFKHLSPLINFSKLVRVNLPGNHVLEITKNCHYSFNETGHKASILFELINQTLKKNNINLPRKAETGATNA